MRSGAVSAPERTNRAGDRVVRVRPDVPAVDRTFDYVVADGNGPDPLPVGTIVRVPLQGRSVRGWVVAADVDPDTEPAKLRPVDRVVGAGPPAEVVALADWAAWRWAGPAVAFLRAASAPNHVPVGASPATVERPAPESDAEGAHVSVHRVAPAAARGALTASLVAEEGSTIVVLADGRRTGALVRALGPTGRDVVVLRADRSDAERTRAWARAAEGGCVVVGGRAAIWAPVPDLASVVVLDEGDEALKEERAPTWHARDVAVERARRAGVPVALVSPAPTLDALAVATEVVRPSRPDERAGWPRLEVVDRREEPPGQGLMTGPLADALHRAIAPDAAGVAGRAVCVLNRKGRARLLACVTCRELARCEVCGAAVAEVDDGFTCPRCSTTRPRVCLHCHATRMKAVRPGVARLRDDLAALLPRAEVVEVDATTDAVPVVDVLVGTEAVLHRVPAAPGRRVRLVAFLDVDQELLAPRARAAEQALWLLVRAARLVGGRGGPGRLLAQTRVPDHEVLDVVGRGDPDLLVAAEEPRRRALGYPPYGGFAELSGATAAVDALAAALAPRLGVTVLGPLDVGPGRRALVQTATVAELADALGSAAPDARAHGRLRVDVDPTRV